MLDCSDALEHFCLQPIDESQRTKWYMLGCSSDGRQDGHGRQCQAGSSLQFDLLILNMRSAAEADQCTQQRLLINSKQHANDMCFFPKQFKQLLQTLFIIVLYLAQSPCPKGMNIYVQLITT